MRKETSVLEKAMKIHELWCVLENRAHDDRRLIKSYTIAETVHETEYVLSCFYESGHLLNESLNGTWGKEEQKDCKKQVRLLKQLIKEHKGQ